MSVKAEKLLKTKDVALRAGVSPRTVARWLRDGELKGVKLNGHSWRVYESALEEYLEGQRTAVE